MKVKMGSLAIIFMYTIIISIISVIAYFVIKKSIKEALTEYYKENNKKD